MNSLQQQLLQAGLVDAKTAKEAQKQNFKQQKMARKNQLASDDLAANKIAADAKQARAAKREQSRQHNEHLQQQKLARELSAQARDMLQTLQIDNWQGELAYNFVDSQIDNKIKTIKVNPRVQRSLISGSLCIGRLDDSYVLLPKAIGTKIASRLENIIIFTTANADEVREASADDYYADFVVPDDLMW